MRFRYFLLGFLLCVRVWAQPATLAGFSDEGTFLLYANEERVGQLTFQWKPDGTFASKVTVSLAGQSVAGTLNLTPDAEGRWTKAVLEDPASKTVWEREGQTFTYKMPGSSGYNNWPKDSLTFETWTPPLISLALRRFDKNGAAKQNLPVVGLNLEILDANLRVERQDTVERTVKGRRLKLTRWVYAPPAHEYHVLADEDGRVYLASGISGFGIPEQNAVFVREGYEELRETPYANEAISQPQFEVAIKSAIQMPMRDGVKLSADLYMPAGAARAPVILIRTPYKKEMLELQSRYFARRGYVVAVQDVRGRFASEGQWEPFLHEAKDGYDTIEWLARQPWSTGRVGMIGESYLGWVQWWAASLRPPHLAAMIPNVSPPDPFHNIPFDNGALLLQGSLQWANMVETNATADLSGAGVAAVTGVDFPKLLMTLPVLDLDKAILGRESSYWRQWLAHPTPDGYWAGAMFTGKLKGANIPVFHQSGWFDDDGIGTKLNYLAMVAYGHANQKLTLGPWEHTDTATRLAKKRDFGSAAAIDLQHDYLRWFDYWLKGIDNGIAKEPLVSLFVMGSNRWLHGPVYPLPETHFEKLYLSGGGHANAPQGDGKLSFTPPAANQAQDRYVYDPGDPSPGNRTEAITRKDILIYTTEPFDKPYTMAGPLSAVLYAASSARDTDWFVHLMEVDEEGKASVLWGGDSAGHIRARYRNGPAKPELLKPGEIYKYTIDLWHTGVTIAPGHRLRVEVSSAAFPLFDRNLNTGGNNETETRFISAEQTIYHDARHPSYILLPGIPEQ